MGAIGGWYLGKERLAGQILLNRKEDYRGVSKFMKDCHSSYIIVLYKYVKNRKVLRTVIKLQP